MKEFSEIAKSAHISNDAIVEYPGNGANLLI